MIEKLLSQLSKSEEFKVLLPLLLSPEELAAMQSRIIVYKELLLAEKSQREIAKVHNISIATITRGSNNLKSMSAKEKRTLETLLIGNKL